MKVVDVNVLLYEVNEDAERHAVLRRWWGTPGTPRSTVVADVHGTRSRKGQGRPVRAISR